MLRSRLGAGLGLSGRHIQEQHQRAFAENAKYRLLLQLMIRIYVNPQVIKALRRLVDTGALGHIMQGRGRRESVAERSFDCKDY